MAQWDWWHQNAGGFEYRLRELLRAVWDLHAMYGADAPWLWRGQPVSSYGIEPAIHTRIRHQSKLDDVSVVKYTDALLNAARSSELHVHEGMKLPDMALLALLQHHGAATPLLDVSLDPIVGLYMATVSPRLEDDSEDGTLFAIRRPNLTVSDYDSRSFDDVYASVKGSVAFYSAPDVSERLRIQRGHFLLGSVSLSDPRVSIALKVDPAAPKKSSWIWNRMDKRGQKGPPPPASTDVAVFRVPQKFKARLRSWLEERSGLTRDFVYPTSWHQPHLDRFAASHGRMAKF
jgi:hypothetical protein